MALAQNDLQIQLRPLHEPALLFRKTFPRLALQRGKQLGLLEREGRFLLAFLILKLTYELKIVDSRCSPSMTSHTPSSRCATRSKGAGSRGGLELDPPRLLLGRPPKEALEFRMNLEFTITVEIEHRLSTSGNHPCGSLCDADRSLLCRDIVPPTDHSRFGSAEVARGSRTSHWSPRNQAHDGKGGGRTGGVGCFAVNLTIAR